MDLKLEPGGDNPKKDEEILKSYPRTKADTHLPHATRGVFWGIGNKIREREASSVL